MSKKDILKHLIIVYSSNQKIHFAGIITVEQINTFFKLLDNKQNRLFYAENKNNPFLQHNK